MNGTDQPSAIIRPFPMPHTAALVRAYDNLYVAENGTEQQQRALGNPGMLPKPWDPGTIVDPQLRYETWLWLDDVVTWFNHEHVWNLHAGHIPACWPHHPHLVHEIAVLADQRRNATLAIHSDTLEDWHRYSVPAFLERLKQRTHDGCETQHADWPGRSRYNRHAAAAAARNTVFSADSEYLHQQQRGQRTHQPDPAATDPEDPAGAPDRHHAPEAQTRPQRVQLHLINGEIDPDTGEVF